MIHYELEESENEVGDSLHKITLKSIISRGVDPNQVCISKPNGAWQPSELHLLSYNVPQPYTLGNLIHECTWSGHQCGDGDPPPIGDHTHRGGEHVLVVQNAGALGHTTTEHHAAHCSGGNVNFTVDQYLKAFHPERVSDSKDRSDDEIAELMEQSFNQGDFDKVMKAIRSEPTEDGDKHDCD